MLALAECLKRGREGCLGEKLMDPYERTDALLGKRTLPSLRLGKSESCIPRDAASLFASFPETTLVLADR